MAISDKILNLRKENGLSQEAFAEKLGVSRQSVSKWESGTATPDIDKIVSMSELFGVSTDYLLKEDLSEMPVTSEAPFASDMDDTAEIVLPPDIPEYVPDYGEGDGGTASDSAVPPAASAVQNTAKPEKKKTSAKAVVAWVLVICIMLATLCIPLFWGQIKNAWWSVNGGKVQYPYVLVHGLGGWGESTGINDVVPYWGSTSGSLSAQLRTEGYEVVTPSVGPVSSAWDRACELYAQLTGTRVDYGEAHSKTHNHERFGRTYTQPLVPDWGEKLNGGQLKRVNLVGHSFGGATVRLLTSLLEYGSEAEKAASGSDVSPLFEGGKGDWVFSVTTLCAPHNGSSLTEILNDSDSLLSSLDILGINDSPVLKTLMSTLGLSNIFSSPDIVSTTDLLISFCMLAGNITQPVKGVYDLMLDHFGIGSANESSLESSIEKVIASGNDHAAYDLSPDGAAALNSTIKTVDSVYYFSYAYSATRNANLLGGQAPTLDMLIVLQASALGMGTYTGTTAGGIVIDERWQENDGLVSVVSAQKPDTEEGIFLESDARELEPKEVEKGIWNISPTLNGHHGTVIGLAPFDSNASQKTPKFYTELFSLIDNLKR
ncbi:MAG: helix-turn-helix domain-containing protein [Clostridia bacterium]|nr:helix-turn-helix domain-containing protein [Clostridia bacterium]